MRTPAALFLLLTSAVITLALSGCAGPQQAGPSEPVGGTPAAPTPTTEQPSITTQPADETVAVGQTATFTVTAIGTQPLSYQWRKNGINIAAATSTTYATPPVTAADTGATFDVVVTNTIGNITSLAAKLTVVELEPQVTWSAPATIIYGTALSSSQLDAEANVPGTFAYVPGPGTVLDAGNHTLSLTFTPADTTKYSVVTSTVALAVKTAALTVTANDVTRTYEAANPALTVTISGYANGDGASVLSGAPVVSTNATNASAVGSYAITVGQGTLASTNYTFSLVNGTLTVTMAQQTINFGALGSASYGVAPITLNGTATSGLPVSYTVAGPGINVGTVLDVTGAGNITVTATQGGNGNYAAAAPVVQTLVVTPAVLLVQANNATREYGTANPALTATISGYVNGDAATALSGAPAVSTNAIGASAVGTYAITVGQGTLAATNYTFSLVNGTLTVIPAVPIITWAVPTAITYGIGLSATQLNASTNLSGTMTYKPGPGTVLSVGDHQLEATFTPTDTLNYSTSSASVVLTVMRDSIPPSVPTGLVASAASPSVISLSWTPASDDVRVSGYYIFRGGTQVGVTSNNSYWDSGLAPLTTYSYTVAAFDQGGNVSGESATALAVTLQSGGALPSQVGWFAIPNTQLASVCPSPAPLGTSCNGVIEAWSGGAADTLRNRLVMWGGGHTDYAGNEVYALDLNNLTMNRLDNPSAADGNCLETYSDGNPTSRHTYGGLAYIPTVDKIFAHGGALFPCGLGSVATWTFDENTLAWTRQDPTNGTQIVADCCNYHSVSAYDNVSDKVYLFDDGNFWRYDYTTNAYQGVGSQDGVNPGVNAVVDEDRRRFFLVGPGQVWQADISSGFPTAFHEIDSQITGCGPMYTVAYPGLAYDPVEKAIIGWAGGNTVYVFNPDTMSCTAVSYPGGPPPGAAEDNGTFGRFRYFPSLGVFATVNGYQQNGYTLRLIPSNGSSLVGPLISNVYVMSMTNNQVIVNWTTDSAATSVVEFGLTTAYGKSVSPDPTLVTNHSVTLTGLAASTLYHYHIHSANLSGVESISADLTFVTTNPPDITPPIISISSPENGAPVSGTVAVSASASDDVGVSSVQFFLDGANLGPALISGPYVASWDSRTATHGIHTLTAAALDAAGNVGNARAVVITVFNPGSSSPSADADFQARCFAPGVIKCVGWDNPSDFAPASGGGGYASGLYPADDGSFQGTMDTSIKKSGAGALKLHIRGGVPLTPNASGFWFQAFGPDDNRVIFAQNSTFYFQFRLRLSPALLNFGWSTVSDNGWKVFITYGPIPGPSCTGTQIAQENTDQRNIASAYSDCGAYGLSTNGGNPPYLVEQGDYACPYNGPFTAPNCFAYPADTWITEYWEVQVGTYGAADSHIVAWIAPEGQPLQRFIDLPNYTLLSSNSIPTQGFEEIELTNFLSGANGDTTHPDADMWFDELIISSQPIAAPVQN
jgi:hypothetical protein